MRMSTSGKNFMSTSFGILIAFLTFTPVLLRPGVMTDTNRSSERATDVARPIRLIEGLDVIRNLEHLENLVVVLAIVRDTIAIEAQFPGCNQLASPVLSFGIELIGRERNHFIPLRSKVSRSSGLPNLGRENGLKFLSAQLLFLARFVDFQLNLL